MQGRCILSLALKRSFRSHANSGLEARKACRFVANACGSLAVLPVEVLQAELWHLAQIARLQQRVFAFLALFLKET